MERWEPPAPPADPARAEVSIGQPASDRRELWAMAFSSAAGRAGFALLCLVPRLVAVPSSALVGGGVLLVLGIAAVVLRALRGRPPWLVTWLADLVGLGLVTPLLVMNAFVAADALPLLPAERSAYLQTAVGALVVFVLLAGGAWWLSRDAAWLAGLAMLPAALQIPALLGTLDDFRDATVLTALGAAYAVAALATVAGWFLPRVARGWLPAAVFGAYVGVLILLTPGLRTVSERSAPTTTVQPLLLLVAAGALVAIGMASMLRGHGPRGRRRGRPDPRGAHPVERFPETQEIALGEPVDAEPGADQWWPATTLRDRSGWR